MADVVKIDVQATDNASRAIGGVRGALGQMAVMAGAFAGALGITAGLSKIAEGVRTITAGMIEGNAAFEQYDVRFQTLLGSADAAKKRMEELAKFGRETPFDLPEVVQADIILQGFGLHSEAAAKQFGFSGEQIRTIAGDVASGTGASFNEIALALGRFSAGATGEAMMRFQELGVVTRKELAGMGIQFSKAGQLLSPLPQAMQAVLTAMQSKYGGLMAAQSATFDGMLSNLRDWAGAAMRETGKPLFDALKAQLQNLLTLVNSSAMTGILERITASVASFATALGGFLDGLLTGITNIGTALSSVDIAAQIDAINASMGTGQSALIDWKGAGLELAKGLGQAAIEFQYLGDFGRLTATGIQQMWMDLASWFQATFTNGVLRIVGEGFHTIGIEARIAWATVTGNTDALTAATDELTASQNVVRGAIQSFGVEGKFWFNELIADAGRYGAAIERLNVLKAGSLNRLGAVGGTQIGPQPRPADAERWGAGLIPPMARAAKTIETNFGNAATNAGDAWKSAFDGVSSYISSKLSAAQDAVKGLLPDQPDQFAPGGNGPFENIFRAADVAAHGAESQWASKLGIDQETAKRIVSDFQKGLITEEVAKLIDMPALIDAARMNQAAKAMTDKFVEAVAGQAGVPKKIVNSMLGYGDKGDTPDAVTGAGTKLGSDLVTSLDNAIAAIAPGAVSNIQSNLTTPIIRAFDDATAAVERLIDAIKRLAALNAKPPAGGGGGGGSGGANQSGRMSTGLLAAVRARGLA